MAKSSGFIVLWIYCAQIATPKKWSKHRPLVQYFLNKSVHTSKGGTPFYVNRLHQPLTLVSFVRSPSLSGGSPLNTLGANAEDYNAFYNGGK